MSEQNQELDMTPPSTVDPVTESFYEDLSAVCAKHGVKQWFFGSVTQSAEEMETATVKPEFFGFIDATPHFLMTGVPMLMDRLPRESKAAILANALFRASRSHADAQ